MAVASSEHETPRNIRQMHSELLQKLSNQISSDTQPAWNAFKNQMTVDIKPAHLARCNDIFQICAHLFEIGKISYGRYKVLSDAFDKIPHKICYGIVKDYTTKIEEAQTKSKDTALDPNECPDGLNLSNFQGKQIQENEVKIAEQKLQDIATSRELEEREAETTKKEPHQDIVLSRKRKLEKREAETIKKGLLHDSGIPRVTIEKHSYSIIIGNSVTLQCSVISDPGCNSVIWQRLMNGIATDVSTDGSKYKGSNVEYPSLTIESVSSLDEGTYICLASNVAGTGRSVEVSLNVTRDRRMTFVRNNLQLEQVDVIACAVDNSLNLGASGKTARDILTFGGETLQRECEEKFPSGIKFRDVIAINAGELKCNKVYLSTLPEVDTKGQKKHKDPNQRDKDKAIALETTIYEMLKKATEEHRMSIALPAIGTRKLGLASDIVAKTMYDCVKNFPIGSLSEVRFVLNERATYQAFEDLFLADRLLGHQYNMSHKRLGIAVVINNNSFQTKYLPDRTGSIVDVENVCDCFQEFGFIVDKLKDVTYEEILKKFKEIAAMDHTDNDCFFCVIMSYGDAHEIQATDRGFYLKELLNTLNSSNCPSLLGKPKVFFIQSCGRGEVDTGCEVILERNVLGKIFRVPHDVDFLLSYSTGNGKQSYRNPKWGSPFILTLCRELRQLIRSGEDMNIYDLLNKVNDEVSTNFEAHTPSHIEGGKLMPTIYDLLNKVNDEVSTNFEAHTPSHTEGEKLMPTFESMLRKPLKIRGKVKFEHRWNCDRHYTKIQDNHSDFMDHEYNMSHKRLGMAVVINNKIFKAGGLPERKGSEIDQINTVYFFEKLGLNVDLMTNVTFEEIMEKFTEIAKMDHSDRDCFFCVIMSHGDENGIWATDQKFDLKEILERLNPSNCPSLLGKPKVFFIESPRGKGVDTGSGDSTKVVKDETVAIAETAGKGCVKDPNDTDFLISFSTVAGKSSFRHIMLGSPFINALCGELRQLIKSGEEINIYDLLNKINEEVSINYEANMFEKGRGKQMPYFESMLRKRFKIRRKN